MSVLLGKGNGTFQAAVSYGSGGSYAYSVAVLDVNGDSKPDLLVTNYYGVGVLLGNGDGTFQTAVAYGTGGYQPRAVAVDVDGDGKPDLLMTNTGSNNVNVLLGKANGTFQTATAYGAGGYRALWAEAGDLNGDGKPDLVVANECVSDANCNNGTIGVLMNNIPSLKLTPTSLDFGIIGVGNTSRSQAVSLKNTGSNMVSLTGTSFAGDFFLSSKTCTTSLAPNATCQYVILFKPSTTDLRTGTFSVSHNGWASPATLTLKGTGKTIPSTITYLASTLNPSTFGFPVTFTAKVTTAGLEQPTGSVAFNDESTTLSTVMLNASGVAAYTTSALSVGAHSITAVYGGDNNNATSTSAGVVQTVQRVPTSTALTLTCSPKSAQI